jgi:hypothetical protein
MNWTRNNFKDINFSIDINLGTSSYKAMTLMSIFTNYLIATSIFSRWAALLNTNIDKVVTALSKWFNASIDISNLIPQECLLF